MSASTGAVRNQVGISFALPWWIHLSPCMCPEYVRTCAMILYFQAMAIFDLVLPTSYRWPKDPANIYMFTNAFLVWTKISWKNPRYFIKNIILLNVFYWYCFRFIVLCCFIFFYCFNVFLFFIFLFLVVYRGEPVRAPAGLLRFNQYIYIYM